MLQRRILPHQIMSFAAPLGVGNTSNGEYVDIEVSSTKDSETMKKCLNGVMSEGFEVVSYRGLPDDAANAMSIVGAGDYTLAFRPGYEPEDMDKETWFQGLIAFFERPSVMVTKKTKRGEKEMDLKPLVYELRICPEGDGEMEGPRLFMKISAGSAANVKPEQVLDAYYGFLGKERPPFALWYRGKKYMRTGPLMLRRKPVFTPSSLWNSWVRKSDNGQISSDPAGG